MIEIVVMTTIVAIGVVSTLAVANATIRTSADNENRVAAVNLAREGVELVRAARDSNWQSYGLEQQAGLPENQRQDWDCFVTTAVQATATPAGCTDQFRPDDPPRNYRAYPNTTNGVPYFVGVSAAASNTKNPAYLLCPDATTGLYQPAPGSACSTGPGFYRRVQVRRSDLGSGNYSLFVRSSVNWPGRSGGDIIIETYLSDWRKF